MLEKDNTGLIVVDVQGELARLVHDSEALISNCMKLIKGAQVLGLPVIVLEQNSQKLGSTVEEIVALIDDLKPIEKWAFNGCESANLVEVVKAHNLDTWLVCGIEAHICVYQTAIGLAGLGYNVELVSDCVSSRTLENKHLGITRIKESGVAVTGLEMSLYELVGDCRASEFKSILDLIR
ncbi:isochorismatase family protein [Vibrio comitans]|uniref:Hydrolase n=1 Tax=Vibrio comitans NBRC 102076 TaxID=1219078 RepID=A0A4Y3IJH1_9VIBR|nr:isochorismatase family protein [Vibrio comitans]GEA59088.1 hydrolase [Vibrio comitans NBRC 102076]